MEEDQFIEFKTAKLANEKGFNILTRSRYREDGSHGETFKEGVQIMRPTQTKLQRWLREVHNLHLHLNEKSSLRRKNYKNIKVSEYLSDVTEWDESFEKTIERGLLEALKLIR
jgi:thiamine kinase-like enzyme